MNDKEISLKAKEFADEQGSVPTTYAFQEGARWYRDTFCQSPKWRWGTMREWELQRVSGNKTNIEIWNAARELKESNS